MIVILTHSPQKTSKEFWKAKIKTLLNRTRGPAAVVSSLHRGLLELGIEHMIDPPRKHIKGTVHVVSGTKALAYAIKQKKLGLIHTLIAGPNIVVRPQDNESILLDPAINSILIPSEWTRDFYATCAPSIAGKIIIWPAGTQIPEKSSNSQRTFYLVYKKQVPENLYNSVLQELDSSNTPYKVLTYGTHSQAEYHRLLNESKGIIYLQQVESQGLALQEAWARNVPSLVWNPQTFTYPTGETVTGKISAPYLNDRAGMEFKDTDDFKKVFLQFKENLQHFDSRAYCTEHLSDRISAQIYSGIINTLYER